MFRAKGAIWVVKRIAIALVVLGVALSAVSCGKDGNIYGKVVVYNGSLYYGYFQSFPSGAYTNTDYQMQAGTYNYYYNVYDSYGYFYPAWYLWYEGYSVSPYDYTYVYKGTYTTQADKGSFPFINGQDNYFILGLYYNGLQKTGSGISSILPPSQGGGAPIPQTGTKSWTEDGLQITATSQIVKLTPEELNNKQNHIQSK